MASLSYFPCNFLSLPSRFQANTFPCLHHHELQCPPILRFSSIQRIRATRKLLSDTELCDKLRQFAASIGLPDGHVPSMKELKQHGRKDLANIVRRKGYRFVKDLLANSTNMKTNQFDLKAGLAGKQIEPCDHEGDIVGQDKKVKDMSEDAPVMDEVCTAEQNSAAVIDHAASPTNHSCMSTGSQLTLSLQEKVVKFIKCGELEAFEDNSSKTVKMNGYKDAHGYMEKLVEMEPMDHGEGDSDPMHKVGSDVAVYETAVKSWQNPSSPPKDSQMRVPYSSAQWAKDTDVHVDMNSEVSELELDDEIEHLKSMLHEKELELSQLKEQIEKEEKALAILQSQAENEINEAQKLLSEMDAELQSAEESLSGLKEVPIQYIGEGEMVEVAGSFNGWQQRIPLDLLEPSATTTDLMHPSSSSTDPTQPLSSTRVPPESRSSRSWYTILWLYPGVYEIKFIVDGQWRIDPCKESVTRGGIENNIVRVDR
ncbi:hypothetical protein Ancab_014548 [Ancistrocladus abbreviatus]